MGYYTPTRLHPTIVVLPQCEAFSACFAGRHSIPDLRDTKLTEGERLVRHLWHYTAGFCVQTLAGALFQKQTWPPHGLSPATA